MNIYHVVTGKSTAEIEAIKEVKPPRLLLSYFYFRNKQLADFINQIGYNPEVMMDSGAYSAATKGKGIALTEYMQYIKDNERYITEYISLDVIGDGEVTHAYYEIMRGKGFDPVPVVHYGRDSEKWMKLYYEAGQRRIALGGTVPIKDKYIVAAWANICKLQFPAVSFHLLGSTSEKVISQYSLDSSDSSTWIICALNGIPATIVGRSRTAKIERAKYNLRKEMNTV